MGDDKNALATVATLVIGAGLAGLTLASKLSIAGFGVVVVEKSPGVGGRMSTRQTEYGGFDHGAQYVTSRTQEFSELLARLNQAGSIAAWRPRGRDNGRTWWVGQPGMSNFVRPLAEGLDIRFSCEVTALRQLPQGIEVSLSGPDGRQDRLVAERVVAAIPAPQAYRLLADTDPVFAALVEVRIAPCWAGMVAFAAPVDDMIDIHRISDGSPLALIARNGSKPGRKGETYVLHASPAWSRDHLEDDPADVALALYRAFEERLLITGGGPRGRPDSLKVHRWRYALTEVALGGPFLGDASGRVFACGDWCLEGRAEAAFLSGAALAEHLITL